MNWENLVENLRYKFFTEFLMQLTSLLVIICYFIGLRKSKTTHWLAILAIASLLQDLIYEYHLLQPNNLFLGKHTVYNSIYLYLIIEITCCLFFIKAHIKAIIGKKAILTGYILFIGYIIGYWSIVPYNRNFPKHIELIEGFLIITSSLYFFYEWFTQYPAKPVFTQSSFWAIFGMLVMFCSITPLFLFLNYLGVQPYNAFFAINNIAYSLMFITFIKAILAESRGYNNIAS
jgi:hypothetical protein